MQIEHDWESPQYSFTPRPQPSWDTVWHHAQARASRPDPAEEDQDDEPEPFEIHPIENAWLNFASIYSARKSRMMDMGVPWCVPPP
jgi:hypothetical protein